MRRSYLDTFFRHWLLLSAPVIATFLLAVGFVLAQARSYTSTATVWCDASIPNGSTVEQGAGTTPPSGNQEQLLTELLDTRQFQLAVARHSPMAGYVAHASPQQLDSALTGISKSVTVDTPGPQVMSVTFKATSSSSAQQMTRAVVEQFVAAEVQQLTQRDQAIMSYEQRRLNETLSALTNAATNLTSAAQSVTAGQGAAPALSATFSLVQQYTDAQQQYDQAAADLASIKSPSVLSVVDPAQPAVRSSRTKRLVVAGLGGLLGGIAIMIGALAALMATDRTVRAPEDLASYPALEVVGEVALSPLTRRLPWASGQRR